MAKSIKCKPCGGSSLYWDWVEEHGFTNDEDTIPEPESISKDSKLEAILDVLNSGGEDVLSPRQKRAFQLVIREGLTHGQAAKRMRVKIDTVSAHVMQAARKLRILAMIRELPKEDENFTSNELIRKWKQI